MTSEADDYAHLAHLPDFDPEEATKERKLYFEGLDLLRRGESKKALKQFRRGSRKCEEPFDLLSAMGAGECQRLLGKEGAALRTWKAIAEDGELPESIRYVAWMSIAALEESRGNERAAEAANVALAELGEPDV